MSRDEYSAYMTFEDWAAETRTRLTEEGIDGAVDSGYELYLGLLRRLNRFSPAGTSVYERDWDVLVVLDACRVDVLREVAHQYPFLSEVSAHRSPGSCSPEWMNETFGGQYRSDVAETAYVTGNPFSERRLNVGKFDHVDEVWKYAWDEDSGTIPPRPITDRAIATARECNPERLIIHYMQPHFPSLPDPLSEGISLKAFDETWRSPLDRLRDGELTRERVWQSYQKNLEWVLGDLSLLLENMDAETVAITADHGEAFGEYGIYEHPCGMPISCLREVPWVETSATDKGNYEPETEVARPDADELEEKLSALGYV